MATREQLLQEKETLQRTGVRTTSEGIPMGLTADAAARIAEIDRQLASLSTTSTTSTPDLSPSIPTQVVPMQELPSATPTQTAVGSVGTGGVTINEERAALAGSTVQQNLTDPQIPGSAVQTATDITTTSGEFMSPTGNAFQVDTQISSDAAQASAATEAGPGQLTASQMEAAQVGGAAQATAATDTGAVPQATAAQQDALSQSATAAVAQLPAEFLTSGQLTQLLTTDDPEEIPAFARPAVAAVERMLAQRGISRSSIGAEQLTNTLIQSALPIAQANANALQANFEANLNRQQQVNMLNTQLGAQLDLANLNNRQQSALFNVQQTQQMRLANLSNEQQTSILNAQMRQQSMLSDQAAENAARQFNASSEQQMNQFMESLSQTVKQRNADRLTATSQFNAGQANAMDNYAQQLTLQRDQFNAQNATAIEQSNVQWRRQVNQINTAAQNAVNQANAMNAFNLSNQALTFMWQEMRDAAKWTYEAAQNDAQRKAALAQAALGNEAASDASIAGSIEKLGSAALNLWAKFA